MKIEHRHLGRSEFGTLVKSGYESKRSMSFPALCMLADRIMMLLVASSWLLATMMQVALSSCQTIGQPSGQRCKGVSIFAGNPHLPTYLRDSWCLCFLKFLQPQAQGSSQSTALAIEPLRPVCAQRKTLETMTYRLCLAARFGVR